MIKKTQRGSVTDTMKRKLYKEKEVLPRLVEVPLKESPIGAAAGKLLAEE